MAFLHGVETTESRKGISPINLIRTGVIALVGIAPKGAKNQLIQVLNQQDAAQFGSELAGFNIPEALNIIVGLYKQAPVLVVNVFDATTHTTSQTDSTLAVTSGKIKTTVEPISGLVVKTNDNATTLTLGTDYTVDDFGNITILTRTTYADGTLLKATYNKLNISAVSASTIVGSVDSGTGARTGSKLFDLAYTTYGYKPKLFISPGFTALSSVATQLASQAAQYRGITYRDSPVGTTVSTAISSRGPSGTIGFNTSNERIELLYPQMKRSVQDPAAAANAMKTSQYSAHKAGLRAWVDSNFGFWFSDSNREILSAEDVETVITSDWTDPNSEANQLNAAGITTYLRSYGTGIRSWGNRSSTFPTDTFPTNFINIRRVADTVYDSLELAMLAYVDRYNINDASIDEIRNTCNAFINTLIQKGALLPGSKCTFNPDLNTAAVIGAGQIIFTLTLMAPTPMERITFNAVLDTSLFDGIGAK